ncbi:MAG: YheC/YheD family protein [Firmicutes bacterium]|nr:YheC/YheD family protein [Bacillota bacterium]
MALPSNFLLQFTEDTLVMIPRRLAQWLSDNVSVTMVFAHTSQRFAWQVTEGETLFLPSRFAQRTLLPVAHRIGAWVWQNHVFLGPSLSILTVLQEGHPLREQQETLVALCQAAERLGAICSLLDPASLAEVRPPFERAVALVEDRWTTRACGWPDLIYTQMPSRALQDSTEFVRCIDAFASQGIPIYGLSFAGKREVFDALAGDPLIASHLLPYASYMDIEQLMDALRRWGALYAKPDHGSLGRGILWVGVVNAQPMVIDGRGQRLASGEAACRAFLSAALSREAYIFQKDARCIQMAGCLVDFRLLMQRDAEGRWRQTKWFARQATRPGVRVTNLARGAQVRSAREILVACFGKQARYIHAQVDRLGKAVASRLGKQPEFAELGIDIAIDRDGKPWLIEVNYRPSKRAPRDQDDRIGWLPYERLAGYLLSEAVRISQRN